MASRTTSPALQYRAALGRRAPHESAHSREELVEVEGLGQIVVGAGVEAEHHVTLGAARREHQDGHRQGVVPIAQRAADREAVQLRQVEVQHDAVEALGEGAAQTLLAVVGHRHRMPLELQKALQIGGQLQIVFHDEDGHDVSLSTIPRSG